jgi:hypothetical protein
LLLGARFVKERRQSAPVRPRLAALTVVLAVISALEMALLFHPSFDSSRVYYGTDTRAFGLLFGAALAMVWPSRALGKRVGRHARDVLDVAGAVGLVAIVLLVWRTNEYSPWLYRGGMVVLSLATVLVIAALAHPVTRLGRLLGCAPLRWIGVRSYGIYLWHAPVIVLTTPLVNRGVEPLRAILQVAGTVGLAALSWRFVEQPIRHGALRRLWHQVRTSDWRPRALPAGARIGVTAGAVALALAIVALAGVNPGPVRSWLSGIDVQQDAFADNTTSVAAASVGPAPAPALTQSAPIVPRARRTPVAHRTTTPSRPADPGSRRTSCTSVVHIGDSTSEGLISSNYLPDPRQRLNAQYARVGVRVVRDEITGATSIVETLPGGINAYKVAQSLVHEGYRGCWVIALGTNDSADIYVGSSVSLADRIGKTMSVIGRQPVMWVNAKTLVTRGPYSESEMRHWNDALLQACSKYPNMRVYDWASIAKDKWFIPDGIHYYSSGYAARAHLFADALAEAFPAGRRYSSGCTVTTPSLSVPVLGIHH